ncbi:hypothetical protein FOMPIDRAFT_95402 [Fomitopsis schrenkii]|uniref:Uncharacterized protein n=1 Tax=Fomitopsis schrenkii TaxID=2126942 RepID=S8FU82_FOMSC|nr:hypothetical protein FOMPIDRAFT_95402 [Fomitopsis schrenkii]
MPGLVATALHLNDDPWWAMVLDYVDDEHIFSLLLDGQTPTITDAPSECDVPSLTSSPSSVSTNTDTTEGSDVRNHLANTPTAAPGQASNDCIRVGLSWMEGAFQQTLEPFRVSRGAILNPIWIDTPRVGLGIGDSLTTDGWRDSTRASEADCVLWPGSLSRRGQATSPYYIPPPSPVSFNGRSSEDYTWAVALSTYDQLNIEPARHATGHLTSWARAYEADREQRQESGRKGTGVAKTGSAAAHPPDQAAGVVPIMGAIDGQGAEELARSPADDPSSLSDLGDLVPRLVGLDQ